MQMDTLTRNGRHQTWLSSGRNDSIERTIAAITGHKLTLDIPLPDSLDARYLNPPGTTVSKIRPSIPLTQAGVECLKIQCPPMEIAYGQAPYSAIRIEGEDCWVKDVVLDQTINSTVMRGKRITMQQVSVFHKFPNLGASKPTDFSIEGSQILLDRCSITGDNLYFVWTASLDPGPNVLLNCTFHGHGRIQPHMRWSTGLLVDNCRVPEGGIDLMDRGVMGSGHGWAMGWGVAWNCLARTYVVQNPPGAANWAIGCIGQSTPTPQPFDKSPNLPVGLFDAHGTPVAPQSLYLAQLAERLGSQALRNIGYSPDKPGLFADSSASPADSLMDSDPKLGADLALHRPVNASNVRSPSRTFGGEKTVDGDNETYWTTADGITNAWIEVDLEGAQELNAAELQEATGLGQRVTAYKIEGQVDSDWKLLAQGATIGDRKVDRFPPVKAWKVRLTVRTTQGPPAIRKFGLYLDNVASPASFKPPTGPPGPAD
jgi:hypothetical protein